MSPNRNLPDDHGWDNRRLILASLAPRTTSRPARKTTTSEEPADTGEASTTKPSLARRAVRGCGRALTRGAGTLNKAIPAEHRTRALIVTLAIAVVAVAALAGVKYLSADISPPPVATPAPAPPPPPSLAPLRKDDVLRGIVATDLCPRDANYSEAARAFDEDSNTAWICTRAKNQDGQTMQIDFGRQVTITQIRAIGGFDALAPDGTDQWPQHRIVTKLEIWFPKDLKRDPVTIDTDGARSWRSTTLDPPATVSKLLIRVAETSTAPQTNSPTQDTAAPTPEDVTTVAISEIQFIGTDTPHTTPT